jgi:FkbM family methyltransferase
LPAGIYANLTEAIKRWLPRARRQKTVQPLSFVSYAQNFEDVLLWRALKGVRDGFYIDLGAADPEADSVTCAFYQRGWRGINIEPQDEYFDRLVRQRPEDLNLKVAVSDRAGEMPFYVVTRNSITGLSTLNRSVATKHEADGWRLENRKVEVVTLADICGKYAQRDVHFLKIDVEGAEREVLAGADFEAYRPWIILIEATRPNTQEPNYLPWEPLMTKAGYRFVWFDGLNRFYVAAERYDCLAPFFQTPPNVFDNFVQHRWPGSLVKPVAKPDPFEEAAPVTLSIDDRIAMAASCRDTDTVPKVAQAGTLQVEPDGTRVQIMHNGVKVVAGGYHGEWMTRLIELCRGHHEPQKELVFHEAVSRLPPNATMLELGGCWAYYSLWFLGGAPGRRAIVVEPDPARLAVGQKNASLNHLAPEFVAAFIGAKPAPPQPFRTKESGTVTLPGQAVPALLEAHDIDELDILHCDAQGAELAVLESCQDLFRQRRIKWLFISTHAHHITNDPLTHQRCLAILRRSGAVIEAEHDVHESFSGDGLIVARFCDAPADWVPIKLSRNRYSESLFRNPLYDLAAEKRKCECTARQDIEAIVAAVYRAILMRPPDAAGLKNHTDRLIANGLNLERLLEAAFGSKEFASKKARFFEKYFGSGQ